MSWNRGSLSESTWLPLRGNVVLFFLLCQHLLTLIMVCVVLISYTMVFVLVRILLHFLTTLLQFKFCRKFLPGKIPYYANSTIIHNILLLRAGDIEMNPGDHIKCGNILAKQHKVISTRNLDMQFVHTFIFAVYWLIERFIL